MNDDMNDMNDKPLPRRFSRNPRREGYERDASYVGTTDADIARLQAAREIAVARVAEPGDAEHAALFLDEWSSPPGHYALRVALLAYICEGSVVPCYEEG